MELKAELERIINHHRHRLSGSGKGTFLKALEDRGYFCVDNLPLNSSASFTNSLEVRGRRQQGCPRYRCSRRQGLHELPTVYAELRSQPGVSASLWFLEASDAAIVRRFRETRRPHPLDPGRTVMESIADERALLAPIRAAADRILDTSQFTIHDLRKHAMSLFRNSKPASADIPGEFWVQVWPAIDSDLVFDVRFLPNPNFVPNLKSSRVQMPRHRIHECAGRHGGFSRPTSRISRLSGSPI
jgi:UPF0042 nucleotide-binding protein